MAVGGVEIFVRVYLQELGASCDGEDYLAVGEGRGGDLQILRPDLQLAEAVRPPRCRVKGTTLPHVQLAWLGGNGAGVGKRDELCTLISESQNPARDSRG